MTMIPSNSPTDLIPRHVKAARALLAWSQQDLAKAAKVATSTVADFERGQRTPVANNAQAIRAALETAGIRFLPTGAVIGPAVPIVTQSSRPGAPVRWVSAQDLSDWANRTDGAVSLPTLLAFLIRATHGTAVRLRFPADEGVRHPGWDGQTDADDASEYVPQGVAGWEIGAQRSGIPQKAADDYRKRTDKPAPIDAATATYIFVTPRHWPQKDEWAKARKAEGPWHDVRVYDADDLVHWIEQTPAVGLWLATRLGKRPPGTRELDEVWEEWSRATQWPLTEDLVLSDRDQDAAEVLRWLRGEPSVLSLQATTTDEAVAFFHAALSELPDDFGKAYRARCLVATTAAAARALTNAPAPLILLLTEPEPGLARALADRGHYVLQAYDDRPVTSGQVRTLARPSREGIASALMAAGIADPRAKALARDSARNLAVLRRLIPAAPGRKPKWAEDPPPHALLAALLAGGWDENGEADKARVSELADAPYDSVVAALTRYVGQFDSPLQKIGSTWRIASPSDAWPLLAHHLTAADIKRFEAAAHAVLGSADPRFDLDPNERWMAAVRGVHRDYSGMLRHGIGQVLILLALWGDRVVTVPDAKRRADAIVAKLLQNADDRRWWSLSRDFRLLAEASPSAFLSAVEDSLGQNNPPISALFGHDEGGIFGAEHLSDLMWALESLAWSPDWMPRVTHVLARLDAIDVKPRRYTNGPANSLREIHLLWSPQTFANLNERLRALDLIRKRESNAAWKLMLGILPRGHDTSSPSPMPRWRDFSVDTVESVTWALIGRGAAAVSERLLADVGTIPARWVLLLDRIGDLAPGPDAVLEALEAAEPRITNKEDRAIFWNKLRGVLHHNRQFADAEWSLRTPVLDRLEAIYDRFAPDNPLEQIAWLFQQAVQLPKPSAEGWQAEQRDVEAARLEAARALYAKEGIPGVLALSRLSDAPGWLGKALYDGGPSAAEVDALIEAAARSEDSHERDVAHGLIISAYRDRGQAWAAVLISKAREEHWGDAALMTILRALPVERWTWNQVATIGGEIETTYWKRTPILWMNDDRADVTYALRKLIEVGRARPAVALAGRGDKVPLASDLLLELLQEALRQPFEADGDSNEATMFQHYVTEILGLLDERNDVDRNALIMLEWHYLQLLEHSRRPPKVLLRALSEQPALFIQMLSAIFKPTEESGVVDPEPPDPEKARVVATQAYRLLELWNRIPGTRDDGTIDSEVLESWIKEARVLAKAAGREKIADSRIGNMLSASPMGTDGAWPAEAVRDVLDLFRSKAMIEGFEVGKSNRQGVTTRSPRDGGALERHEAAQYRAWAKAVSYEHPHTAKALDHLAERYEWEAQRHDEDAERLDWEA
ncbi:MAG: helix-turn-helix transcriptional regulator [Reyranella sp.]|nr:helix-turn-helix transcriptional regulator [Reyranella sp.]